MKYDKRFIDAVKQVASNFDTNLDGVFREILSACQYQMIESAFQSSGISSAQIARTNAAFDEEITDLTPLDVVYALNTRQPIEMNRAEEEKYKKSIELIKETAMNKYADNSSTNIDTSRINKSYFKAVRKNYNICGIQPLLDFMNECEISIDDILKYCSNDSEIGDIIEFLGSTIKGSER